MTTASFYVDQAKLLLLWAGTTTNPVIRKQLRQRAQEYLLMADALEVGASPAISELPREPTVMQQQQQQQQQQTQRIRPVKAAFRGAARA
jgi:hypothetical protein